MIWFGVLRLQIAAVIGDKCGGRRRRKRLKGALVDDHHLMSAFSRPAARRIGPGVNSRSKLRGLGVAQGSAGLFS